jgi:hypothetical protein
MQAALRGCVLLVKLRGHRILRMDRVIGGRVRGGARGRVVIRLRSWDGYRSVRRVYLLVGIGLWRLLSVLLMRLRMLLMIGLLGGRSVAVFWVSASASDEAQAYVVAEVHCEALHTASSLARSWRSCVQARLRRQIFRQILG